MLMVVYEVLDGKGDINKAAQPKLGQLSFDGETYSHAKEESMSGSRKALTRLNTVGLRYYGRANCKNRLYFCRMIEEDSRESVCTCRQGCNSKLESPAKTSGSAIHV